MRHKSVSQISPEKSSLVILVGNEFIGRPNLVSDLLRTTFARHALLKVAVIAHLL